MVGAALLSTLFYITVSENGWSMLELFPVRWNLWFHMLRTQYDMGLFVIWTGVTPNLSSYRKQQVNVKHQISGPSKEWTHHPK